MISDQSRLSAFEFSNLNEPKIAFIKESCYQDLWVGATGEDASELVHHTHMRIGPLGIFDALGADFYVVRTNQEKAAVLFRKYQIPKLGAGDYSCISMKTGAYGAKSQTNRRPCDFEIDPFEINWNQYSVVISINYAAPLSVRLAYPSIVWICMPGEGKIPYDATGWDYWITHNCPKSPLLSSKIIDMPYTFLTKQSLKKCLPQAEGRSGIYIEINSLDPAKRANWLQNLPEAQSLHSRGYDVFFHPNKTEGHLRLLASCRYFVKLGGRGIRGNGFIEAMAAGLICLMKPSDCFGNLMLPKFCYFASEHELILKLKSLESSPSLRNELLSMQHDILDNIVFSVRSQLDQALFAKKFAAAHWQVSPARHSRARLAVKRFYKNIAYKFVSRFFGSIRGPLFTIPPIYEM